MNMLSWFFFPSECFWCLSLAWQFDYDVSRCRQFRIGYSSNLLSFLDYRFMFYQISDISIIIHSLFHLLPSLVHISLLNSCDGHGGMLDGVSASEARVIFLHLSSLWLGNFVFYLETTKLADSSRSHLFWTLFIDITIIWWFLTNI